MNTYTVTLPNGKVVTTKSKRVYTHVIVGHAPQWEAEGCAWEVRHSSSLENATKARTQMLAYSKTVTIEAIEAN